MILSLFKGILIRLHWCLYKTCHRGLQIRQIGDTMTIGDVIHLRCRGNKEFTVVFVGNSLVVVQDCFGQDYCVNINNVRRRL